MKVPQEVTPLRRSELEDDLRRGIKVNLEEIRHWLMTGIEYVTIGTCKQLPMKLAYSMTVHKAQGMTLDSAHIITSGFAGCHGIGYVAVSRVRSLDTISFDRKPVPSDFKFNQKLIEYI
jgi:ATP-dependent exoDNAse (exonuclease V) alpha subunit